jgi:hypothetical protein
LCDEDKDNDDLEDEDDNEDEDDVVNKEWDLIIKIINIFLDMCASLFSKQCL